jgi:lysosomal Pro-X carboxypeptidase
MADYPYPSSFLGPLPAWPVNVSAALFDGSIAEPTPLQLLTAEYNLANLFYNYSGQAGDCFELQALDPPGLTQPGWDFQCCTEIVQSLGQYGPPTDMFWPAPFDVDASIAGCQQQYNGTTPRPTAGLYQYGGARALAYARNIVFTQGTLDPWSKLGPMANVTSNPSVIVFVIQGGAHHLDLRAANPADPQSVVDARNVERAAIRRWLDEWHEAHAAPVSSASASM